MTKTHLITLIAALLFSAQVKAGDSSPNASNLATIFDPNVISCNVDKTRTRPYTARVELKVSETASRQYVFFEKGDGIVMLEDGTTALLSVTETAAFFGYSEDEFKRDPVLHIRTTAESWTGTIGIYSITAAIDTWLLDLIDEKASLYFNPSWNLNINQFKAWLATIVWAESGYGGYGAHSQGSLGGDYFYHIAGGTGFRFSTGLGPFQLDRYSSENWHLWRTGQKLDPQLAVESAARWHRDNRGSGSTLSNFSNNSPWVAVSPDTVSPYWSVVTGTAWSAHSGGSAALDWHAIKNQLASNATAHSNMSYSDNVVDVGYLTWNIKSGANLLTESGRPVIFDGNYQTWLVTARPWGGQPEVCKYYYTYRTDGAYPIEVWVWDNNWDTNNKFKYVFARECNGQFPEWRSGSNAGYPALGQPAIITVDNPPVVNAFNVTPASVTLGDSFTIFYTVSDDIGLQQTELWRANDVGGAPNWDGTDNPIITTPLSGQTSYSSSFTDAPPSVGTYWYGMHVVDSSGQWSVEPDPPGPIQVTVTPLSPPNDTFANATTISASSGQTTGSNVGATKEPGEPSHAGNVGGASVWWRWTAPASGQATINTNGSGFDTLLGVYTGSSVGSLTLVASDDDEGDGTQSLVTFNAVSGTTYRIAVDGYGGVTGNIILNWSLIPSDTTPPTVTITSPTSNPTYSTSISPLSIGGTASDNVGVTQVEWSNDRGGSGTCSGTTSWSASGITLYSGQNVITVTARDAVNNTGTDTLTVSYIPPSNHDPDLSGGYVEPPSGDTNTNFYWYVDYYDQDGDSPTLKNVYIDGTSYTMSLYSGSASNGTYRYGPQKLAGGSHDYCFYFTDGNGGSDRLPSIGMSSGPLVPGGNYNTGWKSPTATGSLYNTWTNPENAYISDDIFAVTTGDRKKQDYGNFGFNIPSVAIINGIEVRIEGHFWPDAVLINCFLGKGNYQEIFLPGYQHDEFVMLGGSTDTWEATWNPSDFSDANFKPCFWDDWYEGNPGYIDHIEVKIYYTKAVQADLNSDGIVNFFDYAILATHWLDTCFEPDLCEGSDFDYSGRVDFVDLLNFVDYWLWCRADLDLDGAVNFSDYAIFAYNWMDDTCCDPNWCEVTDFDHSGSVDMLDLATFVRYWLEGI